MHVTACRSLVGVATIWQSRRPSNSPHKVNIQAPSCQLERLCNTSISSSKLKRRGETRTRTTEMATAFEPSFSASGSRPTMAPVGPSVVDSLPSINFGFDDLRDRMAKFTTKFDEFIEQGRKRVLEERNKFRINVVELQGTTISLPKPVALVIKQQAPTNLTKQRTNA